MAKKKDLPVLAGERQELADGRRRVNLTIDERAALLAQRQTEQAVGLFLDLSQDHTWQEIADTLGISLSALKRLTKTQEFQNTYSDALATVGHDPRLQAVTSSLVDLLPSGYRRLGKIIQNPNSPDGVALRAVEKLFAWTGVDKNTPEDDPAVLSNFLKSSGVQVSGDLNVVSINLPPEYQQAFAKFFQRDTHVDGVVVDSDSTSVETEPSPDEAPALPSGPVAPEVEAGSE